MMNTNTKLPTKKLYLILLSCALIIFISSLETMIKVKDTMLFNDWVESNQLIGDNTLLLNDYISINLSIFFSKIIIPVIFAIYTYYAYIKIRINQLYVFIWTVLNIGGLAYTVVELRLDSIFYYFNILGYVIMLLTLLSLIDVIRENKSK
ncbi:hypothetical protein QE109_09205 [Fusibacter bizertensis]|uniref:DUF4306 domain-containing protein n=1 Tax=Fusibacter bizertensis TaxID=1488331 RepID=A0ABT6ND35_9FIRM|nr:hypothetical protein [Fusibacter bizertensis]MDH8678324.1 hypothetical protein [Fusibacter bizertensis]